MSVIDDGEILMAKLNANERSRAAQRRAARQRDELAVEVQVGISSTGYKRIVSKLIPRRKLREIGFDV